MIFLFHSVSFAEASFKNLSPEEKLFCMLSSSLIENNKLSHDSLNPEKDGKNISAQILAESWNVSMYYELLNLLNKISDYKHCDNYYDFSTKISESKIKPLISSAANYGIPFNQLCYFLYAPYLQDKLGASGTMAWNYGNALTILRLAIGVNLIDETEAREQAKPFIEAITKTFCSFEDYCCHYLYGASFFYCNHPEIMPGMVQKSFNNFVSFISKYKQYFPQDCFHGNNSNSLTFNILINSMQPEQLNTCTEYISIFKPLSYFKDYENAEKIIESYLTNKSIAENFKSIEDTPYFYEVAGNILLNAGKMNDIQALYESAENLLAEIPTKTNLHDNVYMLYAFSAFSNENYIKAINITEQISEDYAEINEIYHIKALSYTYRFLDSEKANDSKLAEEFLDKSIQLFVKAYKAGYELSKNELEFILRFSGESIEKLTAPAPDFWKI